MKTNKFAKNSMAVGLVTLIVTAGLSFSAQAADAYNSNAEAKFLTGTLGGTALPDDLTVAIEGAAASEPATADRPTVDTNPIAAPSTPLSGVGITLGAVNNYAEAGSTPGASRAASGAVSDSGAINTEGGGLYPADATVDLSEGSFSGLTALAGLKLDLGAVSSSADLTAGGAAVRDYNISGANLELTIPALATLGSSLNTAVDDTLGDINAISVSQICTTLGGTVGALSAICAPLAGVADIAVDFPSVNEVLGTVTNLSDGGVTVNLQTGVVKVDLAAVLTAAGKNINDLPVRTDLLAEALPEITASINGIVQDLVGDLVSNIVDGSSITLTLLAVPPLPGVVVPLDAGQLAPLLNPLTGALTTVLDTLTPPVTQALSSIVTGIAPILKVLVNVPDLSTSLIAGTPAGTGIASQTAVQILLANGDVANLRLANSLVGPNAVIVAADDDDTPPPADDDTPPPADDDTPSTVDDAVDDGTNNATDDSDTVADADADADVARTLPDTGAPNLLPLWIMGLAFVTFGGAILLNEKRRKLLS